MWTQKLSSGRLVAGLLGALLLFLLATPAGTETSASSGPTISVDAESDASNAATSIGTIESCRAISAGELIVSDIVIESVASLTGMQARLLYDPAVLRVTSVNYDFLLGTSSSSLVDLGEPVPDTDGDFELGAVTFPLSAVSGSGVLARITFEAFANGASSLDLTEVKLADALGNPIEPSDSVTGVYQGPINDASVVVGGACGGSDSDGDGFEDTVEGHLGTDPLDNCGNPSPDDYSLTWPADLRMSGPIPTNGRIDIQDLQTFILPVRIINTAPNDQHYDIRWDLVPGPGPFTKDINIQDMSYMVTLTPPMFGGETRAFNGPACTP